LKIICKFILLSSFAICNSESTLNKIDNPLREKLAVTLYDGLGLRYNVSDNFGWDVDGEVRFPPNTSDIVKNKKQFGISLGSFHTISSHGQFKFNINFRFKVFATFQDFENDGYSTINGDFQMYFFYINPEITGPLFVIDNLHFGIALPNYFYYVGRHVDGVRYRNNGEAIPTYDPQQFVFMDFNARFNNLRFFLLYYIK